MATTRYGLRQPTPPDTVNVTTDISDPYQTIDTNLARVDDAVLATEVTRWNRQVDAAFIIISGVTNTEVDITKATINNINVKNGRTYHFRARVYVADSTVDKDLFFLRVRKTSVPAGTELCKFGNVVKKVGFEETFILEGFWVATADIAAESFHLTIKREAGTGSIDVLGDGLTQFEMWTDPPTITDTQKVT